MTNKEIREVEAAAGRVPKSTTDDYRLGTIRGMKPEQKARHEARLSKAEKLAINRANWGEDIPSFMNMGILRTEIQ